MAVEIEHDWQRWGSAFSRDEVPRELVRLAEAVKLQMNERTPIRLAATNVIGRLVRLRIDSFFLLVPGHRATELSESVIWRMPASLTPKTATDLGKRQDRGSYAEVWTLSEDRAKDGVFSSDRTKPDALGMQSEWRGRTGMFSCLSECWLAAAKQTSDLDQDIAGRIAILKTDAHRLFGQVGGATVHMLPESNHQIKDAAGATGGAGTSSARSSDLRARIEAHEPMSKNGSRWQRGIVAVRAELLRQYNERMQVLHAQSATAEEKLGELWSLQQSTVHAYLTAARKVTETPADLAGRKRA